VLRLRPHPRDRVAGALLPRRRGSAVADRRSAALRRPAGAVHGGIVAAYLDEVLAGAAVHHTDRLYVTGELSVRYVKPTPVERPLLGRGRATRATPRYIDVEATLEDLETREIVARAKGRFFPMPAPRPPSIS